jgi:hypothetical protein
MVGGVSALRCSENGIQEVARSIRVSSTNKTMRFLSLGRHRTAALSENCPVMIKN